MARRLSSVPNIDPANGEYPAGRIRNDNPPETEGTPVVEELYGDFIQLFHKLMRVAGLEYNDLPENETSGFQYLQAFGAFIRTISASFTEKGVVELATSEETQAGIDSQRTITPAGLESKTATETRKGIVELATVAETQTGTDTVRAITPAGLEGKTATETRKGIAELATNAEVQAGTDTARIVTPSGLKSIFVKRGNVTAHDFSLTKDDAWHNLNITSIVPAGSSIIFLNVYIHSSSGTDARIDFANPDHANKLYNISSVNVPPERFINTAIEVFPNNSGLIAYKVYTSGSYTSPIEAQITIRAWIR